MSSPHRPLFAFFSGLIMLAAAPIGKAQAGGLDGCANEVSGFCASMAGTGAVYGCLEQHIDGASANCREAILRVSPVLRTAFELKAVCKSEVEASCADVDNSHLQGCLEEHYASASAACVERLSASNSVFGSKVREDRAEREKDIARIKTAIEQPLLRQETVLLEKATEERRLQYFELCKASLVKEYRDPRHPKIYGLCESLSQLKARRSESSATETRCVEDFSRALAPRFRKKPSQRVEAELNALNYCQQGFAEPGMHSCMSANLKKGGEMWASATACYPQVRRCMAEMTEGQPAPGSSRKYAFNFCTSHMSYYETLEECTEKVGGNWTAFYKQPRDSKIVMMQIAEDREKCGRFFESVRQVKICARELPKAFPQLYREKNQPWIDGICDQPLSGAKCVAKKFFKLPENIQSSGYAGAREERQAIQKACELESAVEAATPRSPERPQIQCP